MKEFDIHPDVSLEEGSKSFPKKRSSLAHIRYVFKDYLAEFLGTTLMILFGDGVVAQVTFNKAAVGSSFLSINIGWAIGLACAIMVAGPVSGAHLNPAVTLGNAFLCGFPWRKVPGYILSQILGCFFGAFLVFVMYLPAFNKFDGGVRMTSGEFNTAGVFATYPYSTDTHTLSFLTEVIDTAVLMIVIMGVSDPRHKIPSYMAALIVGGLVGAIGISIGMMTGYAMNPARDLGPRLFTAIAGWGLAPFTAANYYFWIPIVAPIIGSTLGIALYKGLVEPASPDDL